MSDLQFDSDSSGLLSKNFSAENNLNNGGEFDKQLDTIITKKVNLLNIYLLFIF